MKLLLRRPLAVHRGLLLAASRFLETPGRPRCLFHSVFLFSDRIWLCQIWPDRLLRSLPIALSIAPKGLDEFRIALAAAD